MSPLYRRSVTNWLGQKDDEIQASLSLSPDAFDFQALAMEELPRRRIRRFAESEVETIDHFRTHLRASTAARRHSIQQRAGDLPDPSAKTFWLTSSTR